MFAAFKFRGGKLVGREISCLHLLPEKHAEFTAADERFALFRVRLFFKKSTIFDRVLVKIHSKTLYSSSYFMLLVFSYEKEISKTIRWHASLFMFSKGL